MIVHPTRDGWQVIYQPAHALLAAQVMSHWRSDERPVRWIETLIALAQHDDEARDWTGRDHLTEGGAPLDFTLNAAPSLEQPLEVCEQLHYKSRWTAILISMHMVYLYGHLSVEHPDFAAFIDEQIARQQQWRQELGLSQADVDAAYALFKWGDRFSLILCRKQLPEGERALEVEPGPDGTVYTVHQRQDGTLAVTPWPFADKRFTVSVEARNVSQMSFADDPELEAALKAAPVETLAWELVK